MKILPIGDAHAKADVPNNRFDWLGNFIVATQPDVIVEMGDWYDMPSLSSYDKGKKSYEGRRYRLDINAGNDAIDRVERKIDRYNRTRRDRKIAQYRPRRVKLIGNHEERILRVSELHAELDTVLSYNDFKFQEHGWEIHQYMQPVFIEDIAFSHCIGSGIMNRPISGETPALTLLKKKFMSCVVGHIHLRDFAERTAEDGTKIMGLSTGCYLDPAQYEDYAGQANLLWWKGLIEMNDVRDGNFDPAFHNINKIRSIYG